MSAEPVEQPLGSSAHFLSYSFQVLTLQAGEIPIAPLRCGLLPQGIPVIVVAYRCCRFVPFFFRRDVAVAGRPPSSARQPQMDMD